ncbi:MAG: sarcosine oxidase subunit gamma [Alphaproteobacteria bacterium]|nr:sarcosine oxidase subunit gamma [Alphaproteobacteria bacterium]
MSEAVTALRGANFDGAVTVSDAGLRGMITLRGDLGDEKLAAVVKAAVRLGMPKPRGVKEGAKGAVAWMSPDELLLMVDYDKADAVVSGIDKALKGDHFLAVNVSDARVVLRLEGQGVREVIAKGAPADLSPEGLPIGEIRRTRLGQVAVAFWLSDAEILHLICFRSVGAHVFNWLSNAAQAGSLPGFLRPD